MAYGAKANGLIQTTETKNTKAARATPTQSNNDGSGINITFTQSNSSRKPLVYLDRILRQWTSDPGILGKDTLMPGSSLESLNQIFEIREQELPEDTILNSFTGKIQNITQLCIRFAEEIMQNILSSLDSIPSSIKTFLREIIANTKEGDLSVLSLADTFVITGFFIQKWIAFGFRWCLSQLR